MRPRRKRRGRFFLRSSAPLERRVNPSGPSVICPAARNWPRPSSPCALSASRFIQLHAETGSRLLVRCRAFDLTAIHGARLTSTPCPLPSGREQNAPGCVLTASLNSRSQTGGRTSFPARYLAGDVGGAPFAWVGPASGAIEEEERPLSVGPAQRRDAQRRERFFLESRAAKLLWGGPPFIGQPHEGLSLARLRAEERRGKRVVRNGTGPPAREKVKQLLPADGSQDLGRPGPKVPSKRAGYLPQPQSGFGASPATGASLPTVRTQVAVPLRPPLSITVSAIV